MCTVHAVHEYDISQDYACHKSHQIAIISCLVDNLGYENNTRKNDQYTIFTAFSYLFIVLSEAIFL